MVRFIGLTGGIATGKSTVATMLLQRGAAVIDADEIAREIVVPGSAALAEIVAVFGAEMLDPSGGLDRAALGRAVFADARQRATLESITHPAIAELMAQRAAEALAGPAPLVVADVPLLFENRRQGMFEGTLLVYAPPAVQLGRLVERDAISDEAARQRLAAQLPIEEKRGLATWIIDNGLTRQHTADQVERWWGTTVASGAHAVDEQR